MQALHTPDEAARWLRGRVRSVLRTDSRRVGAGDGFIAWPGAARDARQFVVTALAQGAAACLVERQGVEAFGFTQEAVADYAGLKAASGPIAAAYYEQPSAALEVLAVTGTNGKTSISWWLAQALGALEPPRPCGLIGTLGVGRVPPAGAQGEVAVIPTGLTTPDPVLLQRTLRDFVDEGLVACAIEASSIGIEEGRLNGTQIRTAIFTNFTQDHLDYHGDMQAYWRAKSALFDWPGLRAAVINLDDPQGEVLAKRLQARDLVLWTVSSRGASGARLQAQDIGFGEQGLTFAICEGSERVELATRLIGDFNVDNLLGVIATLRSLDVPLRDAVRACDHLRPVPGRLEFQGGADGLPLAVVDYAHTPDALAQVLQALRPLAAQRGGRLWCVFGCGGDRDPHKRAPMGAAAAHHADRIVLTSDNPRSESPAAIAAQVQAGLGGHGGAQIELDRAIAIATALQAADARDVVLVAGKGHEDYQEIAGVRTPFSDSVQVGLGLKARQAGGLA